MTVPPVSLIANARLRTKDGSEIKASQLWQHQPCFLYCIRRPGCVLCRDEAQQLWAEHAALEAAGLRVVCVVHEWIDKEVGAFAPAYWGGELYHDVDKQLYKVFNGSKHLTATAWGLLNPAVWMRIRAAGRNVKDSNLNGDYTILGGLMVVKAGDGGIAWVHAERTFGEFPETQRVIEAANKAVQA